MRQTATRYAESWHHINPFWYYLVNVIPVSWFPLSLALLWLVPTWFKRLRARDARTLFLLGWAGLVLLFFSFSAGKRGVYILPALPMVALAAGPYLAGLLQRRDVKLVIRVLLAMALMTLLFIGFQVMYGVTGYINEIVMRNEGIDLTAPIFTLATLCGLMLAASLVRSSAAALLGLVMGTWLLAGWWVFPLINPVRTPDAIMQRAADLSRDGELGIVHWKAQQLLFVKRGITHFGFRRADYRQEMQDALAWLAGDENRYLMLPNDVTMRCLDQSRFSVLGYRSRHTWYLADVAAIREKCRHRLRNQAPGTLYHVE